MVWRRCNAILRAVADDCIAWSGKWRLARFQRAVTSIIEIAIRSTTDFRTWNAFPRLTICQPLGNYTRDSETFTSPRLPVQLPPHGMRPKWVGLGIDDTRVALKRGRNGSAWRSLVRTVEKPFRRWCEKATHKNIVLRPVKPLRIASVTPLDVRADVWCLTVPDGHMWSLANGAVVHNSHAADALRGFAARYQQPREPYRATWRKPAEHWAST